MRTNTFLKAFNSEKYKLSKNKEIFIVLLIPIFIILIVDAFIIYDFYKNASSTQIGTSNPWKDELCSTVFKFYYFLFPLLISVFVYACCEVEYKNNNYKMLFTLPISSAKIYFSKTLFIVITILIAVLMSYILIQLSGFLLDVFLPTLGYQLYDFRIELLSVFVKYFIALVAIAMVQFCISLVFRSFIIPLGLSMFFILFTFIIKEKTWSDFFPYKGATALYNNLFLEKKHFERLDYSNICMIFLYAFIGYLLFTKKKKGV